MLFSAGSWENPQLYALSAGGTATTLGININRWAAVSHSGRWLAQPSGPSPATGIIVTNLEDSTAYTIPATTGFDIYDMVFGPNETRLAFLELGAPEAGAIPWAIVIVNLADGSTARFEATMGVDHTYMPGIPIGWSNGGDELLLNTFPPYSEWSPLGIWAVSLPPGTPSASFSTLSRRELLPSGSYHSVPKLSPDNTHLLHLSRDPDYMPAGYEPMAFDTAVNQLWTVETVSGARTMLLEVTDGSALADDADWSPDGSEVIFAQGNYAGETFTSLTLKVRDATGAVRDIAPLPLPPDGYPHQIAWCSPNMAAYTNSARDGSKELYLINLGSGGTTLIESTTAISLLGCISP